jgi:hypothetical protein
MARGKILAALLCASALLVCQSAKVKEPIVKVGNTTLGSETLESFRKVAGVYPAPMPYYFPAQRQPQTFMAECEAIRKYAGSKAAEIEKRVTSSPDWTWKRRYYAALLFFDLLVDNLGFTDKQLQDYYKKSHEEFKVTVTTGEGKDSSYIPPFDSIKTQVADRCFYNSYKPDSAFIAGLSDQDSVAVMNHWIYTVRSDSYRTDFFMRLFFKERTGTEYTDSLEQLVDNDKLLTTADMDVITAWLPESRKNMRKKDLAEWLFKWLSFSERAEKLGLNTTPQFKEMLHWAQRIEFAFEYLRTEVLPKLEPVGTPTALDSALAELIIYDNLGQVGNINPVWITSELDDIAKTRTSASVDSAVYAVRKSVKVKFLQDDRRDEKDSDPAALMAKADSLREAASDPDMNADEAANLTDEAERLYQTLSADFAFTAIGRKALGEMAKTQIDKYNADPKRGRHLPTLAINAYRRWQKLDADPENLCNSYFLTGFAYDEYVKNYSLAEANYKWVLRNAPTCALASDAEFMIQHLGEPMTSIEEIQGQSVRQGREVEFDDGADSAL